MNNPIYSDPEWMHKFLHNAAIYFESRPTNGEDTAYWANAYNAEKCIKIADEITRFHALIDGLETELKIWKGMAHSLACLVKPLPDDHPNAPGFNGLLRCIFDMHQDIYDGIHLYEHKAHAALEGETK